MPNYNQTLQTNNSSLEEIITQLNNMPDAGGGSGDASVEMYTGSLIMDDTYLAPTLMNTNIYYTDNNLSIQTLSLRLTNASLPCTISVAKGTIIYIVNLLENTVGSTSNCIKLDDNSRNNGHAIMPTSDNFKIGFKMNV